MWRLGIVACLAFALAACDRVLGLDPLHVIDARPADAPDAPDLHDKDGDGVPDVLDNCPTTPNPPINGVQLDSDGDGVGDACDPHPMTPGDSIVEIEYFYAGIGHLWQPNTSGWTANADSVTSPPGTTGTTTLQHQAIPAKLPTLDVRLQFLALGSGSGALYDIQSHLTLPSFDSSCELDGNGQIILVWNNSDGVYIGYTPATDNGYLMRLQRDTSLIGCTVATANVQVTNDDPTDTLVTPSLVVTNMQVEIDSITLYAFSP